MKTDLIARYIYAVTRHLPVKIREDVEKELDSLIADMLAERCGDIEPAEEDIKAVLTELGTPEEMAVKYSGEENISLISGVNFIIYKQILMLVLPIVMIAVAFGLTLAYFLEIDTSLNPLESFGMAAGQIVPGIIGGLVYPFAIITFIFAVFERKKVSFGALDGKDMFDCLPQVPQGREKIKREEIVFGIIVSVFFAALFLGFPQIIGGWFGEAGWISLFIPSVIRSLWFFIVLWVVLGVVKESVKLVEGHFTRRVLIVTIICNIFVMISTAAVFLNGKIINPVFVEKITSLAADGEPVVAALFGNLNLLILGCVILSCIIEVIDTSVKAWKYSH